MHGEGYKPHIDFFKLFIRKEGLEILGARFKNFWFLFIMLLITFIAIGFANGSLIYLESKMDDPFVKWVTIPVNWEDEYRINEIKNTLNNSTLLQEEYLFNGASGYNQFSIIFWDKKNDIYNDFTGRTIDPESQLVKEIFEDFNYISGRPFNGPNDFGLIVSEEFMIKNNYSSKDAFVEMHFEDISDIEFRVPLPVIAVVKELPGLSQFAVTPYMYFQLTNPESPFDPQQTNKLTIYYEADSSQLLGLVEEIDDLINSVSHYQALIAPPRVSDIAAKSGYITSVKFKGINDIITIDSIWNSLIDNNRLTSKIYQLYNFEKNLHDYQSEDFTRFGNLTINFSELDKLREFKSYLYKEYGLLIDMALIESRENYNFVSKQTILISLILIGFSILSICLFVSHLLRKHLDKIKINIGTFKAFGLSDRFLMYVYLVIAQGFVISTMFFSFLVSLILGEIGIVRFVLSFLPIRLETNQNYFSLFDGWTFLLILALALFSILVIYNSAQKILKKTPGDLIFGRM